MKRRVAFLFVALTLIQAAHTTMASEHQKSTPSSDKFLSLFSGNNENVSNNLDIYIKACCKERDIAVQLLQNNGFKTIIASSAAEVKSLNEAWNQSMKTWPKNQQMDFDEFISGERKPPFWRLWHFNARYEVSIFIKNGQVIKASGQIDRTML